MLRTATAGCAIAASAFIIAAHGDSGSASRSADGAEVYDRLCSACHGADGGGAGPAAAWLWPKPRNFRSGQYKWRSTDSGSPPTDDDLRKTIRLGVPGTSMHGFGDVLGAAEVDSLLPVLKGFAPKMFRRNAAELPVPPADATLPLERGKAEYARLGCPNCHGESGRGDGPSAASLTTDGGLPASVYDLTQAPLRRPLAAKDVAVVEIYRSLITGLSGTPMPSYLGAASTDELLAVAAYIDSIRSRAGDTRSFRERVTTHANAVADDRTKRSSRAGYWTGERGADGASPDERIWGNVLAVQGAPPPSLGPAQASLSAKQCARCHAPQFRQWSGSIHARAASPGLVAQLLPMTAHAKGQTLESCQRCHAPLAEQLPLVRPAHLATDAKTAYARNPFYQEELRTEGINCAGCHVRAWTRHGPAQAAGSKLLSSPGYPIERVAIYERSDFCLGCHQLPARQAVSGQPLLNTYREWLEGPYMRRGIQCQHCHMSNREHEWKGVHDPETFRQGFSIEAISGRNQKGVVSARARMRNTGAGHYLPTTPTPAAWLRISLVDAHGEVIPGAETSRRVGRHLVFRGGKFVEKEDTRIAPGEHLEVKAAWKGQAVANARAVRVIVEVAPDDYYEGFYRGRLRNKNVAARSKRLFEQALARAEAAHYVAFERDYPID